MRTTAWIATAVFAAASAARAGTFVPAPLAPEVGVTVLNRAEAERWVGRALLGEPAASAVYGDVHLYNTFPYVQARYVHVTSDAGWKRLLYGTPGDAPRAYAGDFGEPRGLAFAPDGRLFVADRALGRITVLRLRWEGAAPVLDPAGEISGLIQPMDVVVHDGGTPADPADDRLIVAEAGAHRVALFDLAGTVPVRLAEFGMRGPGAGEFLFPRAVAVGRRDGRATDIVYVSDAGNHRIARLRLSDTRFAWDGAATLSMEATALDTDHQGNVYLASRRANEVRKLTAHLEPLAVVGADTRLASPRDIAIPFAWVHDHRRGNAAPAWRGQGAALVLETWSATTGVRRLDLGVELRDVHRVGNAVALVLTDAATIQARVVSKSGTTTDVSLGLQAAGRRNLVVPGLADAARVTLAATSEHDRTAEATLDLAAAPGTTRLALRQNLPNPFNPATSIAFDLPRAGEARLEVFDVQGRHVRTLLDANLPAGAHAAVWDGRDERRRRVSSGVYFYRLSHASETRVRKMVLAQ